MSQKLLPAALVSFLLFAGAAAPAQLIDNTSALRNVGAKKYFRFHYDNDYFTKTDYYYSQGITLEYAHPGIQKFFLSKLLVKHAAANGVYGVTYNLFGYTPTSIQSDSILYGDRPYASAMLLKLFNKVIDSVKQQQFSTALQVGVIGPLGQGENIQTGIHRLIKDELPQGWQYQIRNDIIINYQLNFEKKLAGNGKNFLTNAVAEARIGTLQNRASGGVNFMVGLSNNPYRPNTEKVSFYLLGQCKANFIGYDAQMQGGLFNRKSPYTIPAADIERVTFQADAGLVLHFPKLFLSYTQSFLTKEFRTGLSHRWGGVSVGFRR
jgi:lipid A 3-O-deacylase